MALPSCAGRLVRRRRELPDWARNDPEREPIRNRHHLRHGWNWCAAAIPGDVKLPTVSTRCTRSCSYPHLHHLDMLAARTFVARCSPSTTRPWFGVSCSFSQQRITSQRPSRTHPFRIHISREYATTSQEVENTNVSHSRFLAEASHKERWKEGSAEKTPGDGPGLTNEEYDDSITDGKGTCSAPGAQYHH